MRLDLRGHDCRYSVEQILLLLFPQERPEYGHGRPEDGGSYARVTASWGEKYLTVTTLLEREGAAAHAAARGVAPQREEERERLLRRTVKRSFYQAAVRLTGVRPPWGSLTGIRPGKLAAAFLDEGRSEEQTLRLLTGPYDVSREKAELCLAAARVSRALLQDQQERDVSLYVGIPFCPSRCVYCSFVSHSIEKARTLIEPYLEGLHREIRTVGRIAGELGLRIRTVYIGGGTPTILSAAQLSRLMACLNQSFDFSALREYTVEGGRPDTITREKLRAIRRGGGDRISINPQSMNDRVLEAVGRRHTAAQVLESYRLAREEGFHRINMDLIAGLPLDTPEEFRRSLSALIGLKAANITVHTLALKRGASLRMAGLPLPDGEAVGEMIGLSRRMLETAGYEPYYLYRQKFMSGSFENVGWTLPGALCRYNVIMMEELHTVLSLGAGGVTKLVNPADRSLRRVCNPKYPYEYLTRLEEILREKDRLRLFYQRSKEHGV